MQRRGWEASSLAASLDDTPQAFLLDTQLPETYGSDREENLNAIETNDEFASLFHRRRVPVTGSSASGTFVAGVSVLQYDLGYDASSPEVLAALEEGALCYVTIHLLPPSSSTSLLAPLLDLEGFRLVALSFTGIRTSDGAPFFINPTSNGMGTSSVVYAKLTLKIARYLEWRTLLKQAGFNDATPPRWSMSFGDFDRGDHDNLIGLALEIMKVKARRWKAEEEASCL